ncbi:hypothetical protein VOLCADRAFT_117087 [Volvox carteri f. nagariensis]|uniref:Uncharacterized protein n=1 Tax=Volvox carteri f. nagariensis TaxID=3068 RepID=D8TS69_VOLCA|nr:uncharacterized protein VOLCADRAFT_117087 [Volvox carteri f. nagariensis]EFJ49642.1 hypothetical protein VOLCADRAFT_117087 [Volvox carteri f. nagariensis]|eukprot:XP_002949149.1 hypothetical protein VOLCADRAFT_117087 [Volvox carteri f. nagariensis]
MKIIEQARQSLHPPGRPALHAFLRSLPLVARGNLPRVWERVPGGLCEPLRPFVSHAHPTRVGGEFDEGLLHDARDMLDAELQQDILKPVDRWLESLDVVKTRMRKLEGLRLDVDARRRRVHRRQLRTLSRMERRERRGEGLRGRRRRASSAGPGSRVGTEEEDVSTLSGSETSTEEEYELSYGPGGLGGRDEDSASAMALGKCKMPLPAFPRFNAGGEYGAIGDPAALIADVPHSIKHVAGPVASPLALVGAAGPAAVQADVAAALRPKRITAQPLQTSD